MPSQPIYRQVSTPNLNTEEHPAVVRCPDPEALDLWVLVNDVDVDVDAELGAVSDEAVSKPASTHVLVRVGVGCGLRDGPRSHLSGRPVSARPAQLEGADPLDSLLGGVILAAGPAAFGGAQAAAFLSGAVNQKNEPVGLLRGPVAVGARRLSGGDRPRSVRAVACRQRTQRSWGRRCSRHGKRG